MKRATLLVIVVAFLCGAALAASVKSAPEPKHPAPAAVPAQPVASGVPALEAGGQGGAPATPAVTPEERHEGEGGHESAESPWALVARLFNFAVLAGALIYLLRSPFAAFLDNRKQQITKHLTDAAAMRDSAAKQLALIEERMRTLPAELEALKQRGAAEITAEEERIRVAAAAERERMLESARREIDRRVHLAERQLLRRAGELAVDVATERVKRAITDADQARLVDRYLEQVRPQTIES